MTIGPVSANTSSLQSAQTGQTNAFKQRRRDVEALGQALSSGNLSGAKRAFSALQQDFKNPRVTQPGPQAQVNGQDKFQAALKALAQALGTGDLAAAQNAFAVLQQAHGYHHRHGQPDGETSTAAAVTNASPSATISVKA